MLEIVFVAPFITGVIAFFLKGASARPLLVFTAAVHLLITPVDLALSACSDVCRLFYDHPRRTGFTAGDLVAFFHDSHLHNGLSQKKRDPVRTRLHRVYAAFSGHHDHGDAL